MARAKLERYERIAQQIAELIEQVPEPVARRATVVALVHHKLTGLSWTGFYMRRGDRLVVDAYQGPLACLVLAHHQGVCWAAVDGRQTVVVPDVDAFEGHIPCDGRTKSEIVVPLLGSDGTVVGVLDLDSHRLAHFDDEDREGLESIVGLLAP
jgi:L-methionine (R)-S-oxide reductase